VRDHAGRARVEVAQDELDHLFQPAIRDRITLRLVELGFDGVTLDPAGYRQGGSIRASVA
jgi:PP-loop superfamily ATP-utilizing enzyme